MQNKLCLGFLKQLSSYLKINHFKVENKMKSMVLCLNLRSKELWIFKKKTAFKDDVINFSQDVFVRSFCHLKISISKLSISTRFHVNITFCSGAKTSLIYSTAIDTAQKMLKICLVNVSKSFENYGFKTIEQILTWSFIFWAV